MKNIFKNPFYYLGIIFIGIIFGLLFKSASAWIEPSEVTNILSPINSGVTSQTKSGGLLLNSLGATVGLTVEKGRTGIGTTSPQSILDITSTTKALLPPRLTTAQRDTMLSPQFGMVIINTDTKKINLYNGSTWEAVIGGNTLTDSKTIFSNSDARSGDYYCKKTTIPDDGKQGDFVNINENKLCGATKMCKNGECVTATRTYACAAITANTNWNTVSSYTQTWNGSSWSPADSTTSYNATPDTNSCRFTCASNYVWNGSSCVPAVYIVSEDQGYGFPYSQWKTCTQRCSEIYGKTCVGVGMNADANDGIRQVIISNKSCWPAQVDDEGMIYPSDPYAYAYYVPYSESVCGLYSWKGPNCDGRFHCRCDSSQIHEAGVPWNLAGANCSTTSSYYNAPATCSYYAPNNAPYLEQHRTRCRCQ